MEITDIRIKRVESDNKLKAYVTITFDNCFVVHNLKIIMGQFGRFVAMPSRKTTGRRVQGHRAPDQLRFPEEDPGPHPGGV